MLVVLTSGALSAADTRCANQIVDTAYSPNGRFKAIVFVRACSRPARFSTQVSILRNNRRLSNVAGNVFICDGSYGLSHGGPDERRVSAAWNASDELLIRYPSGAEVFAAKKLRKGIQVRYEPTPRRARSG